MKNQHRYKPVAYFSITLLISWLVMFTGAYFSYRPQLSDYQYVFLLVGLLVPFGAALFFIYRSKDKSLHKDFQSRIFNLRLIKLQYVPFLLLIAPLATIVATAFSLLLGQSADQFRLSPELVGNNLLVNLVAVFLAPAFEELGWRGYGVDSLDKKGRSLLFSTTIFAVLWNLWHLPLFFVKGYYHYELWHTNWVYALNFVIGLFPAAFLMNWLFYRNNRSIFLLIIFHGMLNLSGQLLQTEQFTKCIVTLILILISIMVLWKERAFFLNKEPEKVVHYRDLPELSNENY